MKTFSQLTGSFFSLGWWTDEKTRELEAYILFGDDDTFWCVETVSLKRLRSKDSVVFKFERCEHGQGCLAVSHLICGATGTCQCSFWGMDHWPWCKWPPWWSLWCCAPPYPLWSSCLHWYDVPSHWHGHRWEKGP